MVHCRLDYAVSAANCGERNLSWVSGDRSFSLVGGLLTGVLTVGFLLFLKTVGISVDLNSVFWLILIALLISAIASFSVHGRILTELPKVGVEEVSNSELLHHSWPLLINAVTLFMLSQSDLWLLGALASEKDVAIYGAAARLAMLSAMSLSIVNMVVPPLISRMYAQNYLARLERLLRAVAAFSTIPALTILTIYILFSDSILEIIYGEYYRTGGSVLLILCIGNVINVLTGSCGYVQMISGHRKVIMVISIASAILAVSLGIWLVYAYGMNGLASAYAIAMVFQQFAMWISVKKYLGIWTHVQINTPLTLYKVFRNDYQ